MTKPISLSNLGYWLMPKRRCGKQQTNQFAQLPPIAFLLSTSIRMGKSTRHYDDGTDEHKAAKQNEAAQCNAFNRHHSPFSLADGMLGTPNVLTQ